MSTYVYLECLDHDPPLRCEHESGQHLTDLPTIRDMVANRAAVVLLRDSITGYFTAPTARFLAQHPNCRLRIVDEYGREHPLTDPEADQ